jgi:hypothetical protein
MGRYPTNGKPVLGSYTTISSFTFPNTGTDEFGPEYGLATRFYDAGRRYLAINKQGFGGSKIESWSEDKGAYRSAITSYIKGIQELKDAGYKINLLGYVWLQGESNTAMSQAEYLVAVKELIQRIERDLTHEFGSEFSKIPIYLVEPSQWTKSTSEFSANDYDVAKAMAQYASEDPMVHYISNTELQDSSYKKDVIHWAEPALQAIGVKIAKKILAGKSAHLE